MSEQAELIDISYDLQGGMLPARHVAALWDELVHVLPWLAQEELAGLLPLRGSESGGQLLLPRRAKLVLRLPVAKLEQALQLSGQALDIEGHLLPIGAGHAKPLQPHPSLHAHLVISAEGEVEFLAEVERHLNELGISGKAICGKRVTWHTGGQEVSGYSLVVHDLPPADSVQLQQVGMGPERHHGCGLFLPCKDIPDFT